MKNHKNLIIPGQALELSQLPPDGPINLNIGENTLVAMPERMTAIQTVNAIYTLNGIVTELICAILDACGSCVDHMKQGGCPFGGVGGPGECPYGDAAEPDVTVSAAAREQMGIPPDAKLELLPDEGEGLIVAADYKHDITDVPESVRELFSTVGVCPGRLDQLLMDEVEVWHV